MDRGLGESKKFDEGRNQIFAYYGNETVITDEDGNKTVYKLTSWSGQVFGYYREIGGTVRGALKTDKIGEDGIYERTTSFAPRSTLGQSSYDEFVLTEGVVRKTTYTAGGLPLEDKVENIQVSETLTKTEDTAYTYDDYDRLIKKRTKVSYSDGTERTHITRYGYLEEGGKLKGNVLAREASYVVGEIATVGIHFINYTYDEHGNLLKKQPSVRICEDTNCVCEKEGELDCVECCGFMGDYIGGCTIMTYDDKSRLSSVRDETGVLTKYDYQDNTNLISAIYRDCNLEAQYLYDERDRLLVTIGPNSDENNVGYHDNGKVAEMGYEGKERYLSFSYDEKRRITEAKLFDRYTLEEYTYGENITYEDCETDYVSIIRNGSYIFESCKDKKGRYEWIYLDGNQLKKTYDEHGQVILIDGDGVGPITISYDSLGNVTLYEGPSVTEEYKYTPMGDLAETVYSGNVERTESYEYEDNSRRALLAFETDYFREEYSYNALGRVNKKYYYDKESRHGEEQYIYYIGGDDPGTNKESLNAVEKQEWEPDSSNSLSLAYGYEETGNLYHYEQDGIPVLYRYDDQNRLQVEENELLRERIEIRYGANGNILEKTITSLETGESKVITYEYGEDPEDLESYDRMISYNGEECKYDEYGNPTVYRGKTLYWASGKRLEEYGDSYLMYDTEGRLVDDESGSYYYDSQDRIIVHGDLEYFYDESGVTGFKRGETYHYRKDVLGNIVQIIDMSGKIVVQYVYDAWGNHKVLDASWQEITDPDHVGNRNLFRYRGYAYNTVTGFYYLKSRFYDPETGRFINMDNVAYADPKMPNGLNLYAYCNNNPIAYIDPTGHSAMFQFLVSLVSYAGMAIASIWDKDIREDMNRIDWNPFNSNENIVAEAEKVSFYKGVPVFMVEGLGGSFSFGVIGLDKDAHKKNVEVLKHERGHNTQLITMGLLNYGAFVCIPSPIKNGDNTPWELSASLLGGSDLGANIVTDKDRLNAMRYYLGACSYNPILWAINIYQIFSY